MRSVSYRRGDGLFVLGKVFGITSDMQPLDYLTVASLKDGDTLYDCNYVWPFDIHAVLMISERRIAVAANHRRLVMWDGRSPNSALWSKTMDIPVYLAYDGEEGMLAVMPGGKEALLIDVESGNTIRSGQLPFRLLVEPVGLDGGGFLLIGDGNAEIMDGKFKALSSIRADWLGKGALLAKEGRSVFVVSGGTLGRVDY